MERRLWNSESLPCPQSIFLHWPHHTDQGWKNQGWVSHKRQQSLWDDLAVLEGWRMPSEVVTNSFLMGRVNRRQKGKTSQQFGGGTESKDHKEAAAWETMSKQRRWRIESGMKPVGSNRIHRNEESLSDRSSGGTPDRWWQVSAPLVLEPGL